MPMLSNWKKYLPYVDLWVDLGVLQVMTDIMYENIMNQTFEYLVISVTVMRRWGFRFKLYSRMR